MNKFKLNSHGISVLEGLACLAIASIMVLSLVPMFTTQMSVIKLASSSGLCRSYLSNIVSQIDKMKIDTSGTRGVISPVANFSYSTAFPSAPARVLNIPPALAARFTNYGVNALYTQNSAASIFGGTFNINSNGITIYTPLLLDGPISSLADLYNFNGYGSENNIPSSLFPSGVPANYTPSFTMRLEPFNIEDGSAYTPPSGTRFWPRPRNAKGLTTETTEPYTGDNFIISRFPNWMTDAHGIRIYLKGSLTDKATGAVETCEQKKDYSYPQDLHNAIDFTSDFKIFNLNGLSKNANVAKKVAEGSLSLNNRTRDLSNKTSNLFAGNWAAGQGLRPDLRTIFTNLAHNQSTGAEDPTGASDPGNDGRQRPMCSQNQNSQSLNGFYLKFRVYDLLTKEPGSIPLCMDTSEQWLKGDSSSGGWCTNNHKGDGAAGSSSVRIVYDWKPRQTGWVPCENLSFCGEKPDFTTTTTGNDGRPYYEYQFQYDGVVANSNPAGSKHQRLWGCELKFAIAAVDPSGNLVYPPVKQTLTPEPGIEVLPPKIKEVVPRVYFKPPPCYTCDCNRCPKKKGKGGFFGGGFLRFVALAIVSYTTGGTLGNVMGSMGGVCLSGGLGCERESVAQTAGSKYTSCNGKVNDGCSCGFTCQRRDPPGPSWSDTLNATNDNETKGCDPTTTTVNKSGVIFNVKLAGRVASGTSFSYDTMTKVTHGTEITWKQFLPTLGKLCTANFICSNGVWKDGARTSSFTKANGDPLDTGALNDCFNVKTAYKPNWSTNPVTAEFKKPGLGERQCLEVNFNKIPFNETFYGPNPDVLWSSTTAGTDTTAGIAECGIVKGETGVIANDFAPIFLPLAPSNRTFGKATGSVYPDDCATDETIVLADQTSKTIKLGYPEAIMEAGSPLPKTDSTGAVIKDAKGNPVPQTDATGKPVLGPATFKCWKRCDPPTFAPSGPLVVDSTKDPNKTELKYYENYNSSTDSALPFCTIDANQLDN